VSSQSSAASAIINDDVAVAGIGGFSGRESEVSAAWLAQEVGAGRIRWVLADQAGAGFGGGLPGDTRAGSKAAMTAVAQACRSVTLPASASASGTGAASRAGGTRGAATSTLYDCQGRAAALSSAATQRTS
jgi:hypothetical protein